MDDVVYYEDKIYLVLGSQLKEKIMQRAHDSPLVGHPTLLKKYRAIKDCFSWRGIKGDVLRRLHECVVCQRNKGELSNAAGLLQLLPIPKRKWESISMDFITRLLVV